MGPLSGIRVLDISQVMAGPYCCMLLGDMGADVIKIEPRGAGDSTRRSMGFRLKGEDSPGFLALNRNKRSIALDLKSEEDREVLYALVRSADVLVENGRPGVAARLKMDYETLKKINPKLVYASISGFGQTGPWAQRPGFDLMAQAMSGVISATGRELNDPRDQESRFRFQLAAKAAGDQEAMEFDEDYIRALEFGMPPTAGEGIGIDRLTMLLTGQENIRDIILFPLLRPETK